MSIESIKVPDLGGGESVEVIEICVAVGDDIAENDSLVVLESDKASMEVPSPKSGKVAAIKVSDGDSVSEGDVIIELEVSGAEAGTADQPEASPVEEPQPTAGAEQNDGAEQAAPPASQKSSQPEMISEQSVKVPDLGGPEEVDVIEVCVAPGDELAEGDSMVVLESDKASMEIPASQAGKVVSVSLSVGDKVSSGDEILIVETAAPAQPEKTAESKPAPQSESAAAPKPADKGAKKTSEIPQPGFAAEKTAPPAESKPAAGQRIYAGPAVRKLAREMGIELTEVNGSGPRHRITKDDLKAFVKTRLAEPARVAGSGIPPVPEVDFSAFGEVSIEPLNKVQRTVAENMHRSWLNVPRVTQFDDADITELEAFRQSLKAEAEQHGVKLTPLPFLLKACAAALKANPKFNASLHADGESIVYKQYVHIGVAVDTPVGLMVPVIRDVDKKTLWELAAEAAELAQKAKDRKLKPAEMQGGCFSISSLGNIGGTGFTPIINTPEVAILGVSKLSVQPVWNGSEFVPRKMLPLTLAYDHRAINGADAGRFFTFLTGVLADIRKLLL